MLLQPKILAEAQLSSPGGQFGLVTQASFPTGDDCQTLQRVPLTNVSNIFFENNTQTCIQRPVVRWLDMPLSAWFTGGSGDQVFRQSIDRALDVNILIQYASIPNLTWFAISNSQVIDIDNGGFAIDLYLGAAPKGTTDRSAAGIFRQVTWPADAIAGENQYRVTIPYSEQPYIDVTTDGSAFHRLGVIDCPQDLSKISRNTPLTLSVLSIDNRIVVWLGQDLNRGTFNAPGSYKQGTIKVNGGGGYTGIAFGNIRHYASNTYLISYMHPGPRDMVNSTVTIYPYGTDPATLAANGQTMVGTLESTDALNFLFNYRITMTSTDMGGADAGYSKSTPFFRQINCNWSSIEEDPDDSDFTELSPVPNAYYEKFAFDPSARTLSRYSRISFRILGSERQPAHGVESLRIHLGWEHEKDGSGNQLWGIRGYFVANTEAHFHSISAVNPVTGTQEQQCFVDYECRDHFWFLNGKYFPLRVLPSQWCVYALVRYCLNAAGISQAYYQTLPGRNGLPMIAGGDHFCDYGPFPVGPGGSGLCPHTKMPFSPGWFETNPIMDALRQIQEVEYAWMGTDEEFQFRFEPFDPLSFTQTDLSFYERPTADGSLYDEIGTPEAPYLIRNRSVSGVLNDALYAGIDQATGVNIFLKWRDDASIFTRTASNYTAGFRPYIRADAQFISQDFMQQKLDQETRWVRLPYEDIAFAANGQPWLLPLDVISVTEQRVLGIHPVSYFVTNLEHFFLSPGVLTAVIGGLWNGVGTPPGQFPPSNRGTSPVVVTDPSPIPPQARQPGMVLTGMGGVF